MEAVEKSMDALIKSDQKDPIYKRMINESDWSKGKSLLNRTQTMTFIKVSNKETKLAIMNYLSA